MYTDPTCSSVSSSPSSSPDDSVVGQFCGHTRLDLVRLFRLLRRPLGPANDLLGFRIRELPVELLQILDRAAASFVDQPVPDHPSRVTDAGPSSIRSGSAQVSHSPSVTPTPSARRTTKLSSGGGRVS
jgi:hypothetical protein